MTKPVKFRVADGIGIVTFGVGDGNALAQPLRGVLTEVFASITPGGGFRAVVLVPEGPDFSLGVPEGEIGAEEAPTLVDLANAVEACPIPVFVLLRGRADAGAAALAMAAHFRVVADDARLRFPEVDLGLVPGGGATQRLPRLIGADAALSVLLSGRPVGAEEALALGLADLVARTGGEEEVLQFVELCLAEGLGPRPASGDRQRLSDGAAYMAAVNRRRSSLRSSPILAQRRIVDCVEAALLLPFEAGLAYEAEARRDCLADPQSAALRHLHRAERRIAPHLLTAEGGRRQVSPEGGAAVVARLDAALRRAASVLEGEGIAAQEQAAALEAFGFARTPFGTGGTPGPGAGDTARRLVAALTAEGARLVEAGAVARAEEIDVLSVYGLGFPRRRGGPMHWATATGLLPLSQDMARWAERDPVWAPPALVSEAVMVAGRFDAVARPDVSPG